MSSSSFVSSFLFMFVCLSEVQSFSLCGNVVGEDSVWEYCRRGFCEVKVLPRTYKEGGKEEEEEEEEEETVSGVLSTHPM